MLTLDADGIKQLTKVKESPQDVQVTLWDETSFRGQLQEPEVLCVTKGGLRIRVPVPLIEEYIQPLPKPSGPMVAKIRELIGELNADDWSARQKAQEKLSSMGGIAAGVLRDMRPPNPKKPNPASTRSSPRWTRKSRDASRTLQDDRPGFLPANRDPCAPVLASI